MRRIKKLLKYILLVFVSIIVGLLLLYVLFPNWFKNKAVDLLYPTVTIEEKYVDNFSIEVPQVYELMYIACSLTETFQNDDNLIGSRAPEYLDEVTTHFSHYKNHPLVLMLEERLKPDPYSQLQPAIRLFSLNYKVSKDNHLVENKIFHVNPILIKLFKSKIFHFPEHKALIEDFAKKTDFYNFYEDHKPYYDQLKNQYNSTCDLERMWKWIENRSSETYNSYRIIFSPLTGGFHNTLPGLKDPKSNLKQTWMFISPPKNINLDTLDNKEIEILTSKLEREVFSEIIHNYVNPVSDLFTDEIEEAMPDYTLWNKKKRGYSSSVSTFNEYMTWGIFSLYAIDHYPQEYVNEIISIQEDFMVEHRKFTLFEEFNQNLIELYKALNRDGKKSDFEALYPDMMTWIKIKSLERK